MSWRTSPHHPARRLWSTSIACIAMLSVTLMPPLAHAAATAAAHAPHQRGAVKVLRPDAALTGRWWQEVVALSGADSLDRCDLGTGKIVYLTGTIGGSATRTCVTDKAKTFLVPLINVECSTAEGNGTTITQLRTCAAEFADDFTNLVLVIDGEPVVDLHHLRVQADGTFTSVEGNPFGIPAANDSHFSSDGYWALIKLNPGQHTLTFGGSYPPGSFTTSVTYELAVKR